MFFAVANHEIWFEKAVKRKDRGEEIIVPTLGSPIPKNSMKLWKHLERASVCEAIMLNKDFHLSQKAVAA